MWSGGSNMAKANGERDEVAEVMQLTCYASAREEILQEHRKRTVREEAWLAAYRQQQERSCEKRPRLGSGLVVVMACLFPRPAVLFIHTNCLCTCVRESRIIGVVWHVAQGCLLSCGRSMVVKSPVPVCDVAHFPCRMSAKRVPSVSMASRLSFFLRPGRKARVGWDVGTRMVEPWFLPV